MERRFFAIAAILILSASVFVPAVEAKASLLLGWLLFPATKTVWLNPYYNNVMINPGNLSINGSLCLWNQTGSGWVCADSFNFTGSISGSVNKSYFFNNTAATHDGSLGGYSGANAVCAGEFAGTHLCSLQELLDTISDKALPADWSGYAWYSTGGSKYLSGKPTDDCHGWTSNSATDYLGSFWIFGTGYTDAYGSTVNCASAKSLACCKVY